MVDFEMDLTTSFRYNQEIKLKIEWLLKTFPFLYESESHVLRAAINELFNKKKQEVEKLAE